MKQKEVFGFKIVDNEAAKQRKTVERFTDLTNDDGSIVVQSAGISHSVIDLYGSARNEAELITKYREMALHAACDRAIDDIVNETFDYTDDTYPVSINLDNVDGLSESVKQKIRDEFDTILQMLDFKANRLRYFQALVY